MWLTWLKTCSWCGETKESGEYHCDSTRPDGRAYHCKQCDNAKRARHYRRTSVSVPSTGGRVCTLCGEFKVYSEFSPRKNATVGVTSHCRSCARAYQRERYQRRKRDHQIESPRLWP